MTDVAAPSRRNQVQDHGLIGARHLVMVAVWLLTALLAVPVVMGGVIQSSMGRAIILLILVGMAGTMQFILRSPAARKA